jgi:hypothetical protein
MLLWPNHRMHLEHRRYYWSKHHCIRHLQKLLPARLQKQRSLLIVSDKLLYLYLQDSSTPPVV